MTVHLTQDEVAGHTRVAEVTAAALVLPTGDALLLMTGSGPRMPEAGQMQASDEALVWQAKVYERQSDTGNLWSAIALVDTLPRGDGVLFESDGPRVWGVTVGTRVGVSAADLIDRARAISADMAEVFHLLVSLLDRCRRSGAPQERSFRAFVQDFLDAVALHDGFIELLAEPETGGLFLQGWAQSLGDAPLRWISLGAPLADPDLTVAFFDRPDLLSPARGVCLFHKDLRLQGTIGTSVGYFEQDGRLLRLDLVATPVAGLAGVMASEHVARMLPRLQGTDGVLAPFKRICRPLYTGVDTLTSTHLPVAIGLDVILHAPDASLLVEGWLLDPEGLVDLVLIKSRADRYARISENWVRLPRSDLAQAFGEDPRFARRLGRKDVMSGFIVHVPPGPDCGTQDEELYLELVLGDHRCLFRPLQATIPCSPDGLRQVLTGLSPFEPALARIIDDHLVPILSCIDPVSPAGRHSGFSQPVPLGRMREPACVAALVPFKTLEELQPMFALLAGTPEAQALDLTLIAPRRVVEEALDPLQQAFRFYGLAGQVLPAPDPEFRTLWLEGALHATAAENILLWWPQALPKAPGWLDALLSELADQGRAGMISPVLTYEDGSIRFGPPAQGRASALGYARGWLRPAGTVQVPTSAAEIALLSRAQIKAAGGFVGTLLSDAFAHVDLSMRVAASGGGVWCSGQVEFWSLDDPSAQDQAPTERILQRVDARLLARRGAPDLKEHLT